MKDIIPREVALELCEQIRKENKEKRFGFGKIQCSFCYKLAKGDSSKLCIFGNEANRGCTQISKRYQKLYRN